LTWELSECAIRNKREARLNYPVNLIDRELAIPPLSKLLHKLFLQVLEYLLFPCLKLFEIHLKQLININVIMLSFIISLQSAHAVTDGIEPFTVLIFSEPSNQYLRCVLLKCNLHKGKPFFAFQKMFSVLVQQGKRMQEKFLQIYVHIWDR
jgi:hypothetical protein